MRRLAPGAARQLAGSLRSAGTAGPARRRQAGPEATTARPAAAVTTVPGRHADDSTDWRCIPEPAVQCPAQYSAVSDSFTCVPAAASASRLGCFEWMEGSNNSMRQPSDRQLLQLTAGVSQGSGLQSSEIVSCSSTIRLSSTLDHQQCSAQQQLFHLLSAPASARSSTVLPRPRWAHCQL